MRGLHLAGLGHEHLAAHAQVHLQQEVLAEIQPQKFSAAFHGGDGGVTKKRNKNFRVPGADGARVTNLDVGKAAADQVFFEATADDLNLGELRHVR